MAWKELQSPNNVEDMFCSHVSDTNDFRYYDDKVERMYQHSSDAKRPASRLTPAQAEEVRLAASVAESVPPKSLLRHPPRKFQAKFFDQGTEPSSITQIPPKSKPENNGPIEEKYVVGRAQNKNLQQLRPPAWDVTFRYAVHGAKDILACPDKQGLNSSKNWAPSNECNMDIPGGIAARVELKEMLEQNQKVNASKKQTNWTYAHGEAVSPKTWTTTLGDQMTFKSRLRTPKKHVLEAGELREASWSVQERNMVHLGKYDHSLVGLRRPRGNRTPARPAVSSHRISATATRSSARSPAAAGSLSAGWSKVTSGVGAFSSSPATGRRTRNAWSGSSANASSSACNSNSRDVSSGGGVVFRMHRATTHAGAAEAGGEDPSAAASSRARRTVSRDPPRSEGNGREGRDEEDGKRGRKTASGAKNERIRCTCAGATRRFRPFCRARGGVRIRHEMIARGTGNRVALRAHPFPGSARSVFPSPPRTSDCGTGTSAASGRGSGGAGQRRTRSGGARGGSCPAGLLSP